MSTSLPSWYTAYVETPTVDNDEGLKATVSAIKVVIEPPPNPAGPGGVKPIAIRPSPAHLFATVTVDSSKVPDIVSFDFLRVIRNKIRVTVYPVPNDFTGITDYVKKAPSSWNNTIPEYTWVFDIDAGEFTVNGLYLSVKSRIEDGPDNFIPNLKYFAVVNIRDTHFIRSELGTVEVKPLVGEEELRK